MRIAIEIDHEHSRKLAQGRPVTIRVPKGATELTLQTNPEPKTSSFAEVLDVFFNGRRARKGA